MKKYRKIGQRPKTTGGTNRMDHEIQDLRKKYATLDESVSANIKRFTDFPLSQRTLQGLAEARYVTPTEIQRESIIPALLGRDVLGSAITGSGKTLAFLIPVLEHLFVNKWSRLDGVGSIIISPTRELAYQIFETLKKVGVHHDFSAGLIIGGKNLKFERNRMDQVNILICTPGRLLQHMDENPLFNASSMEVLVLDEADRCLDMGFERTLNAIIENLPPQRKTLLFSATQTNSVRDLARLNLKNPTYIGHQQATNSVGSAGLALPELLQQHYVVIALEDKITMLWSFIKNHLKQKTIVFLNSCKQVKYVFEIFCKLRPGVSLLALYGTLHQDRRIAIYNDFLKKRCVVLFATDIASRGLDFPAINWVVQLDCPEDIKQYVHRAGRSARNKTRGESLLVLLPSEEQAMLKELNQHNIQVDKIQIDPKKLFSPRVKMEAFLAQHQDLKASAQRAFIAYIKSVFLMHNKQVFNVRALNFNAYAHSLGLAVTPRVRFLERYQKEQQQRQQKSIGNNNEQSSESASEASDDENFLQLKRADHDVQDGLSASTVDVEELPLPVLRKKREKVVTKAAIAKRSLKKKLQVNEKTRFNEDGEEIFDPRKQLQSELAIRALKDNITSEGGINIELSKQLLSEEDKYDKQRFRDLVKQRHKNLKQKLKHRAEEDNGEEEEPEGGDFDDDDEEHSIDLSWLPDPNKVYQPEGSTYRNYGENNSDAALTDTSADESDDYAKPLSKKPRVTSKLTLDDAEIIAAQLLAS